MLMSPASCANEIHKSRLVEIESALKVIQSDYVPDRRIAVFNMIKDDDRPSIVIVETNVPEAAQAVEGLFNLTPAWRENIEIQLLPHFSLEGKTRAIVNVGVANLRRAPNHQSELLDQVVLGTDLKVLKRERGWYYIQTPWEHLGWVTAESLNVLTEAELDKLWLDKARRYVNTLDTRIYSSPDQNSLVLSNVTLGATLVVSGDQISGYTAVILPDGRKGYLKTSELMDVPSIDNTRSPDGSAIVKTALRFHGLSYLWGGNSGKGLDCSGFTSTVFRHHGFMLPRDANMQVEIGVQVNYDDTFTSVLEGDLLFFGSDNQITHVGISLGGARFIHASVYVMINSLLEKDDNFSDYRRRTLVTVRRI